MTVAAPVDGFSFRFRGQNVYAIREGFRINWMNMRDAASGQVIWESGEWDCGQDEMEA